MSKAGLFLALFAISTVARADEPPVTKLNQAELEEKMCAETKCQHNLRVVLKQKDGTTYDRTFAVFPSTVQGFGITVVAGQTIYVEADIDGNDLVKYRAVDQIANPKITITAKFEQMKDGGMMLSLHNPFNRPLKFNMGIMPMGSDDLYKTSSCPIIAGGGSYEMWPYPIFQVVLGDGRLMNPDDSTACVE
jgi:hypothetical protein